MLALLAALALFGAPPADPETAASGADVEVAVLAHDVERGTALSAEDFLFEPRRPAVARHALAPEQVEGKEAARPLRAGSVLRSSDVTPLKLVRRGEPVTIRFVSGGLSITTAGRALASGGRGDTVRVVANATSRTLDAVVDGTGSVRITVP